MKPVTPSWARFVALVAALAVVSSCGLPRSGPNKREIFSGSVQQSGDAFVISVNDRVTRATGIVPALGFSDAFKNAGLIGSDTIRPGDTLGLTIWENVDDPLLGHLVPQAQAPLCSKKCRSMVRALSLFHTQGASAPRATRLKASARPSLANLANRPLTHRFRSAAWPATVQASA